MPEVYIYLPDDEPETQDYNGAPFHLKANASTRIRSLWPGISPEEIADHIVDKLGMWGACRVRGAVKDCKPVKGTGESQAEFDLRAKPDQAAVAVAERRYLENTHAWCVQRIMEHEKVAKPLREAGLPAPLAPANVVTARKWEKDYHGKLKAASLIA